MSSESVVFLKIKSTASRRTKTKISEHGKEGFVVRQGPRVAACLSGQEGCLFESIAMSARGGRETWYGWLPVDEYDIIS